MPPSLLLAKKEQNRYISDRFRPADSPHLPGLFRNAYGEHYLAAEVYDPDHHVRANAGGRSHSLVVRDGGGRPIGHLGVLASAPFHGVREVGQGVVDPAHRGGGVLNAMIGHAVALADLDPGCCGLFGASLTNHTHSQRSVWGADFVDVGFEIGFVPARMMQIEAKAQGPVATCLQYRPFGDAPGMPAFLPSAYRDLLVHLYDHLGLARQFSGGGQALDQTGASKIDVIDLPRFDLVRVNVFRIGADLPALLRGVERAAHRDGRVMMQVFLDLSSPASDAACEALRKAGFWFGGLLPRWMDSDALLLQKAMGEPYFDDIQAFTSDARALLRFIRADADRQIALAAMGV